MKRSRAIRLVLSGTVAGVASTGCAPAPPPVVLSAHSTYTNNHHVSGAGFYHAPYRAWFHRPFNHYDPARGYFAGGKWTPAPETPATTASQPTPEAAQSAQTRYNSARQTYRSGRSSGGSVQRGGFGRSSRSAFS